MKPVQSISIIVNGNTSVTKRYNNLAAMLVLEGFRVRLLTNLKHHDAYVENCAHDKRLSSSQSPNFIHVNIHKKCNFEETDFFSLMKNMSPEVQSMVQIDSRLQVAMAKCDSKEFMALLKNINQSKDHCFAIQNDLSCYPPDLVIAGQGCEYFSLYAKHVLQVTSMRVLLEPLPYESWSESLNNYMTLDNAMLSLGYPSLGSQILPPDTKIAINTVKYYLRGVPSSNLGRDPNNDNKIVLDIKDVFVK